VIDKLWVAHIDEMQYLKDKVGFMGYAQLDPLVVYKKESFEKFQDLLARIKTDTTSMLMRINFNALAEQQQAQVQIIEVGEKKADLLAKLKSASKNIPVRVLPTGNAMNTGRGTPTGSAMNTESNDPRQMLFSDEDGIEIFEVDGEKTDAPTVILPERRKVRPNDPCPCGSGKKYKKCCGKEQ
jgi:preprotein translocase subunit SecA